MGNCTNCVEPIADGAKFCGTCGKAVIRCPRCTTPLKHGIKFCPECGSHAVAASPSPSPSAIEGSAPLPTISASTAPIPEPNSEVENQKSRMYLCSECGKEVDYKVCKFCGGDALEGTELRAQRTRTQQDLNGTAGRLGKISWIVFLVIGIYVFHHFMSMPSHEITDQNPAPKSTPTEEASVPDSLAVLNSAEALDNKYSGGALVCASDADEYLRSIAKYDFKWDDMHWYDMKFNSHLTTVKSPGVLTFVSDKAEIQNGFGAYQHIELYCDFDTQHTRVLGYETAE